MNIALITDSYFWRQGAGLWARTRETVRFLSAHSSLSVLFLGNLTTRDVEALKVFGGRFSFYGLGSEQPDPQPAWKRKFQQLVQAELTAEVYIVDKTENSFLLDLIPASSTKLVDTHDLISARTEKHERLAIPDAFPLTADEEKQLLNRYDGVICIQRNEYRQVADWIGERKTIYMPHPLEVAPQQIRERATNIGLVASRWHANFNGLRWFLKEVWPQLSGRGLKFHLYGPIGNEFQHIARPEIGVLGFQQDLHDCYKDLDIAINPVYYGSGLKIKSVEALAYGLPLVTTPEGASGLEDLAGAGLLVARDAREFARNLIDLVDDQARRQRLASAALAFVREHFSREAAFRELATFLGLPEGEAAEKS